MREQLQPGLADRAARQHGVVTYEQLRDLGFSTSAIGRMAEAGRPHSLYRAVYAVGHRAVSYRGKLLAAVYASGEGAALSHYDAAWLWRLWRGTGGRHYHVSTARKGRRGKGRIRLHCVRELHPDDVTVVDGIPVTTVARTLLDMAEVLPLDRLRRLFEEAERLQVFDLGDMERACARGEGRRGVGRARAAMREARPEPAKTRSDLEIQFLDFCRAHGIPEPAMNLWVEGQEVDAVWLDRRVVVELDSWEFHRTRGAFERDRVRSEKLQVAEFKPLRVTDRRMETEPRALRDHLLSLLGVSG